MTTQHSTARQVKAPEANAPSGTRFPVGVLSAALTVTAVVLAWLGWSAFQFYCYTQGNLLNTTLALEESRAELSIVLAIGGLFLAMFTWIAVLRSLNRWRVALLELAERSRNEEALTFSERRFRALVQNAADIIMILDMKAGLRYLSPGVERVWGYEASDLIGRSGFDLVHIDDLARAEALLVQAGDSPETNIVSELRLCRADGSWRSCEVILRNMMDEPGVEGIVITYHDITERKAFENQLAHQAFHDSLSGLPNRALFMDRLGRALARAQRHDYVVAVLFLDLDNFKVINDSLGHQAGDELLKNVTQRLMSHARPEDTVARLGGDEFTLLLENLADVSEATTVAGRITEALQAPIVLQGYEMFVTASIGIAVSIGGHGDADGLLRDADIAMYQAKNAGKAHHVVFDRSMNHHAMERLELEAELRRAIENGELRVHYQPIMTLDSGKVSEVEALVRWEHPRRGLVPPAKFIPLAEETGLIASLGHWVLVEACRQTAAWHAQYPDQEPITISVNVSAKQLQQADLVDQVAAVLRDTG
nr:diguanylate cyclase [Armatimonadota bacterium]